MLIGYARVSTQDQNLDLQFDALVTAGVDRSRIYADKASGASAGRPALEECLRSLRPGDTLVVWKLDRLARSVRDLVSIAAQLQAGSVDLKIITQGIDTTSVGGRLVFNIMAAIAEFERDLIRERTMAGLQAAKERGRRGGRKPKLTGNKAEMARQLWANPDHTESSVAQFAGVSAKTLRRMFGPRSAAAGPAATPPVIPAKDK